MAFKLPTLTTAIDCEPIGYPGLLVTFRLNQVLEDYEYPWESIEDEKARVKERAKVLEKEPWRSEFYYGLSRMMVSVTFPPEMTDTGRAETLDITNERAAYELMNTPGFEQAIIIWASQQYQKQRADRLKAEVKNSEAVSGGQDGESAKAPGSRA